MTPEAKQQAWFVVSVCALGLTLALVVGLRL
jgi:hypothetical protein